MKTIETIKDYHFPVLDSTHTWSFSNLSALKESQLRVVTADQQTNGKGRFGNSWVSAPGSSLLLSFSFLIDKDCFDMGNIPQVLAIVAVQALSLYQVSPQIKWPNDILINHKKIAGILTSSTSLEEKMCVTTSIGINLSLPLEHIKSLSKPSTSLHLETPLPFCRIDLLNNLKQKFLLSLNIFLEKGFTSFLEEFKSLLACQPGDELLFHHQGQLIKGVFVEISDSGLLKMKIGHEIKEFYSGEII